VKVDQRKKVSDLQKQFREEFGVELRVYKGNKFADDVVLGTLSPPGTRGGEIDFGTNTKVKNVEKAFMDEMGIKVQVERSDGKLADNEKTLAAAAK
jgi:hypothetical protein|tara:strand:- start:486 stop:773 length:288 start_codon:yes stop_codon:yes gene_type:complete